MKVFEPFRLDTVNHCVWRDEARMPLTPKAFDVLRYLVEHAGRVVTQDEILDALWPETYVNPENIRKYVLEIRKALGDRRNPSLFIETLPKRGYRFAARVTDDRALPPDTATEAAGNMVGRDAALARLNGYFEKALSATRQVIFITGEAGIGKTTLVDVFHQQAARYPNFRLARGQCIEGFGGKEAYYPMLEALGSLLQSAGNGDLVQTLAKHAPAWLAQFPSHVKSEERASLQREILGSTRERMVREICEALEAMAAKVPLIVVLEDLHWVDASTLDLISAFARRRNPAKLLLIGTYRPVDAVLAQSQVKALKQDLAVHNLCHEIAVERLEESDVAEYLARTFPRNAFPSGLAHLIHHNSGGNALFMAAIIRDIVKRGFIAQDGGTSTLTAPLEDIYAGIPETLQQMLEHQLEQLSVEEQRMLESCSVAGERFSVRAAAITMEASFAWVGEACHRLAQRQQFIRFIGIHETADGGDSAHYEFGHALYRQALYQRIPYMSRYRLHRTLGEWLKPACNAGRRELASEIALHFEEARDFEQATRYLILAAENAARRFAHRDSIRVLQQALELASALTGGARIELESKILQHIGDAHYALGAMSDSALAYETAAARAAEAGLDSAQIDALARLAIPAWYLDPVRGNGVCLQAIEVSRAHGDPLLLARTQLAAACFRLLYDAWRKEDADVCITARETIRGLSASSIPEDVLLAGVQVIQGDCEHALRQAEAGMIDTGSPAAYLLALGVKTLSLIGLGRFGELLGIVRKGRELAEKNGEDPWVFIFREAWLRALCFDFEGVRRLSTIIMRSDAERHAAEPMAIAMMATGYAELAQGRCDAALEYFAKVLDPEKTPGFSLHWRWRMRAQHGATEARLQAGDIENARLEADGFLDAALSTEEPNIHAFAWEVRARVAIAEKRRALALECIENALAVVNRFEIPVSAWRVHATAWELYSHEGEYTRAAQHRSRAREVIMSIADSFEPGEPLRESLLSAAPVRHILDAEYQAEHVHPVHSLTASAHQ
jgi:DNA-binding winged helix-turn-helix (wHTH) protein/tetratricopeptide (TPR) repeat protein